MSRQAWRRSTALRLPSRLTPSGSVNVAGAAAWQPSSRHLHTSRPSQTAETTPAEYAERRQRFFQFLPPHSITLLPAADEFIYSHDILSPHRQDSLWYHLFGLQTPLRRQLDPPSSTIAAETRATMAMLAKFADNATHTLLCVPPETTNRATMVWACEVTPLENYEAALRVPPSSRSISVRSTHAVIPNDVPTTCDALCSLIAEMAAPQKVIWSDADAWRRTAAERVAHDLGLLRRFMPQLFAAYPAQLRWDGRRYRLPIPPSLSSSAQPSGEKNGGAPAPLLHHPLEAFFRALHATAFSVRLPRHLFDGTAQPPWDTAEYRYQAASTYTPGLVASNAGAATMTRHEIVVPVASCESHATTTASRIAARRGDVRLPIRCVDAYAWSYRLRKNPSQLRQHLRSARATEHAFVQLLRRSATTTSEHELHCVFQRSVCDGSAHFGPAARVRSAYIPVIASGVRGSNIHYTDNCAEATAGRDVVRVDAGVEVENVPTDCTRTFPIGAARFPSPLLARLYDGLVQMQRTLLHSIAAGVAVSDVARLHLDETRALLCALGVDVRRETSLPLTASAESVQGESAELEQQLPMSLVRSCFCAHSFGHLFGLDIHEEWGTITPAFAAAGEAPQVATTSTTTTTKTATTNTTPRVFQGGMMHTVEPGLYIPSLARARLFALTAAHIPAAFHDGVGVQVEDDVLVLPPPADSGTDIDSWSRGTYLQHALAAFARYYGGGLGSGSRSDSSGFVSPSVAVKLCEPHVQAVLDGSASTTTLSAQEWNVVRFLFTQRLAMGGHAAAVAAIPADVATVRHLTFVTSPAYEQFSSLVPDASCTAWYPFSIVVLTATIPKDRQWMESLMREASKCSST